MRKVPKNTPCGYCFERWATGWDHLIPQAFKVDHSAKNLYPSCKRCNSILGARMFDTIQEKRAYVQQRLGRGHLPDLQDEVSEAAGVAGVLPPEVQAGRIREAEPASQAETKNPKPWKRKHVKAPMYDGPERFCEFCEKQYKPFVEWSKYCSSICGNRARVKRWALRQIAKEKTA